MQVNKFGELHNGKTVFFCKSDFLLTEFKRIRRQKNKVILITGNGDLNIDQQLASMIPNNIVAWYAQNSLICHEKIKPIPIGLENTFANNRRGHGVGWAHAVEKIKILAEVFNGIDIQPTKFLYANFNVHTNPEHRAAIKDLCKSVPHITWQEAILPYQQFINAVRDHEAVICPMGNGADTHRLYEVLYSRRIPIVIMPSHYGLAKQLYKHLPIIVLDNEEILLDESLMGQLLEVAKQKWSNLYLADFNYWRSHIEEVANTIALPPKRNFLKRIFK